MTNAFSSVARILVVLSLVLSPSILMADWYVPGAWDGGVPVWDPASNVMTDMGGGIHQLTLSNQNASTRYEFKVLGTSGDWGTHANSPDDSNMWGYSDANGDLTITLDENSAGNGFVRDTNRVLVSNDPTSWNAVGDFMDETGGAGDWSNGDALFAMADMGGGMYSFTTSAIATPGTYNGRIVNSGTWDGFGTQGRSINSWNWELITTSAGDQLRFDLDTTTGTSLATVISSVPEPSTLALLGMFGLGLAVRRRKR